MIHKKTESQLHFVGIGGIGMSGIAEVLLNQGYRISGSDLADSESTRKLRALGARVELGHRAENIDGAHVVVVSSAVRPSNPEVAEARKRRIPVIPRAEMLGEIMRGKTGIAVAGSHGKTTTTSMLATVLTEAGLDPTLVIGGKVDSFGGNAKLGQGEYVVAEADESDGSFLQLPASLGVITNIDNDHLDHFGNLGAIEEAFVSFVGKLPFYGICAVCGDDPGVRRCLERLTKPVATYGMSGDWDFVARGVTVQGMGTRFCVSQRVGDKYKELGTVELEVPGEYNVRNALAAIVIASHLGVPFAKIQQGLKKFKGVKRRFEIRWQDLKKKRAIIDDYGHHPTEVAATLAAARGYWKGRIIMIFQPHRYSRTLHCHDGFMTAFQDADRVFMTDIYAAGEDPIEGISAQSLVEDISRVALPNQQIHYVGTLEQARERVLAEWKDGDLILCSGAGSITRLPDHLIEAIQGTGSSPPR